MKATEIEKLLFKNGYYLSRSSGSHRTYKKEGNPKLVTVPFHNEELKPGTINSILKNTGLKLN